ncbi:polysaccharide deacetylase family protein [Polaromonas sp. SM01]|uniref:polysaccharide deacetylase family protein n=1 Tax=Polaromonas sp. SM01 TaxID=3085630 RepID=UPI0029821CF9|nr:polysaccharide deacetylase family protein [Polaromonas sp. SM01]MDW5443344.1 polysaccharide deacetylase family protein [Polaromonas sp. SM01]
MPEPRWHSTPLMRASIAVHGLALVVLIAAPDLWPWVLAALVLNHLLIAGAGLWPRSHWLGPNWTRLPAAAIARHEIALTIDDGPDPEVTPLVLDLLDRFAVQATFFCIGEKAARYPELCREIVKRGHTVENHSQQHRHHFSLMGPRGLTREIQAAQDTLTHISGQRPLFFRAPAGLRNPFLEPVLARLGLKLATWSVRGFDTRVGDADRVSHKLVQGLQAGAILLLHDGNAARTPSGTPVILEVLPAVLVSAASAGLRVVTLRQALA